MRRTLMITTLIMLLGLPAAAQEADPSAEFLAGLSGFDAGLEGTTKFLLLFHGQKLGEASLVVERAPEASGAAYRAVLEAEMAIGEEGFHGKETALLDEKFGMVSSEGMERETKLGVTQETVARLAREDDRWVLTLRRDEEDHTYFHPVMEPEHSRMLVEMLIARKLASAKPGTYGFTGIDWPELDEDPDADPIAKPWKVIVAESPDLRIGEEMVTGAVVRVEGADGDVTSFQIAKDGRIVSFRPEGSPIEFVNVEVAAEDPAEEELPSGTGAETPQGAVALYLEVIAGSSKIDALDDVVDWEALHEWFSADSAELAALNTGAFIRLMKDQIGQNVGAIPPAALAQIVPFLGVAIDGDRATVTIPGQEGKPFRVAKSETGWKLVQLPK